ncbi:MAG: YncE family protein [Bacteroidales bacterium]
MNTKFWKFSKLSIFFMMMTVLFACKDDNSSKPTNAIGDANGLYVLCEGVFHNNNSALSFFSFGDSISRRDVYSLINSQGLGETANDMIKVDDELWIAVTGSAMVTVVNSENGQLKKMIPILNENNVDRQPRHLVYYNNYVYLTCFDGNVLKISVKTKDIVQVLATGGRNPEGIAEAEGKLYVANSGGLDNPNYDRTVSVINTETFKVEQMITVMDNPQNVKSYNNRIYVVSTGDYSGVYRMTVIEKGKKIDSIDVNITDFAFHKGFLYYIYKPWVGEGITLSKINVNNLHAPPTNFATVPKNLRTPYRISIVDNVIYVCDPKNFTVSGEVFAFDEEIGLIYSFPTSIGPNIVIKKRLDLLVDN